MRLLNCYIIKTFSNNVTISWGGDGVKFFPSLKFLVHFLKPFLTKFESSRIHEQNTLDYWKPLSNLYRQHIWNKIFNENFSILLETKDLFIDLMLAKSISIQYAFNLYCWLNPTSRTLSNASLVVGCILIFT